MYNLFRKDGETPMVCAVPDGGSLPPFLKGLDWSFEGKVQDFAHRLLEPDRTLCETVIRQTGYYLFTP